jgi:hypothetical protein
LRRATFYTYERTEADEAAGRAFRRASRTDKDLIAEFAGTVPEIVEQRDSDQLFGYRLGAALLSELSGRTLVPYSHRGGITLVRPRYADSTAERGFQEATR